MKLRKKALSLFAVAALLVSLLSVMTFATVSADETNLVTNGDFENGTTGWNFLADGDDKFEVWDSQGVSGGCLTRTGPTNNNTWCNAICYQTITVTPGKTYVFTAYAKNGKHSSVGQFAVADGSDPLAAFDDNDTSKRLVMDTPALTSSYALQTFEFTPTQTTATVAFRQWGGIVTTASFFIDSVSVTEKKVYPTEIVNGGFEDGETGWDFLANGNDKFEVWPSQGVSGGCLTRTGPTNTNTWCNAICYQTIAVTPGKTYVFTAYAKNGQHSSVGQFAVADGSDPLAAFNDNDTSKRLVMDTPALTSSYAPVTYMFTPTETTATVAFRQWGGIVTTASFFIDDVSVVEKVGPAPAVSMLGKSITADEITTDSVSLSWDAANGTAAAEDITYSVYSSTSEITADNIGSMTPVTTVNGADTLATTVTGLAQNTIYYFAVKAADKTPDAEGHSDAIFSSAVKTERVISNEAVEMLVNGDFENIKVNTGAGDGFQKEGAGNVGAWALLDLRGADGILVDDFASNTRKITTTNVYEGDYALSIRFNGNLYTAMNQKFAVSKGYKYTLSFWYKGDAGAKAGITPSPGWNQHSQNLYEVVAVTEQNDEWTKYTVVYYPSKDEDAVLWLCGPTASEGTECVFDNVSVMEEYAPLYFTATSIPVDKITKDSISVSWADPTLQDGVDAVTGYKVYVSETAINVDNVTSLTPVATVTDKAYTFTGLKANTGYYMAVEAINGTNSAYVFNTTATYTQKDEAAPAAGTNLVIDGGFDLSETFAENPREGWIRVGSTDAFLFWGSVHVDVGDSMKLGSLGLYPWNQGVAQWVQVKPNTTYAYSFSTECYLEEGGPGFRVYERADGKWNGKLLAETKVDKATDGMEVFQGTFTTGPDTTEVYINPNNIYTKTGSGGECYFDEIYLVEVEDTSLYMLGGITQVEYGEDYLIVTWPEAQADEEASKLTYKVYASDEPITADNIGSLTAFASVAGDDTYREAELGDLKPGTTHYFAVSVTNSQGKTAYLFSDSTFTTDGEPEEDEGNDNAGGNTGDDSTGGSNAGDDNAAGDDADTSDNTDGEESTSPVTGETTALLAVALLAMLLSAGVLMFTKRRTHN